MSEEILYIDDGELVYYINDNEFITCDEIPQPMLEGIKHLQQKVEQLEKENQRLNNIINELEIFIKNNKVAIGIKKDSNYAIPVEYVLDKLKELKENNK